MRTTYIVRTKADKHFFIECQTMEEAEKIVEEYELEDIYDDCYEENFYEIVEFHTNSF